MRLVGAFRGDSTSPYGLIWDIIVDMTYITECTVLRITFVLQTQLHVDKVEAPVLPGAGSSAQLDHGILPARPRMIDHNRSISQIPAKLFDHRNAVVPDRAALH